MAMTARSAKLEDEIVHMRGLRFRFRDWAGPEPDAPVLLILHGMGGCSHGFDAVAPHLTASHRVLVLDQRGFGQTDWDPERRYGHDDMADDVTALVAALGLDHIALLGHSMGGLVAITYASRRPAELTRLVVVDIHPGFTPPRAPASAPPPPPARVYETAEAAAEALVPGASGEASSALRKFLMRREDGRWVVRSDPAFFDGTIDRAALRLSADEEWARYRAIEVPMLLVRGGESNVTRAGFDEALAANPQASCVEIAGAGHGIHRDAPAALAAATGEFLASGD